MFSVVSGQNMRICQGGTCEFVRVPSRDTLQPPPETAMKDEILDAEWSEAPRDAALVAQAAQPPPNDGRTWPYDAALGRTIADGVAEGRSIHEQRAADPLTIPPAMVILAWRKQHPAFGLLMKQADAARADLMREQALVIVDSFKGAPARLALMAGQRMKMADMLDPPAAPGAPLGTPDDAQPVAPQLSDETLARLAMAGSADAAAAGVGEAEKVGGVAPG